MQYPRSTHYWLWFILFGVIPVLAILNEQGHLATENLWLLGASAVGLLLGAKSLASRWSKPFDLFIGVTFFVVGLLGILHNFGLDLVNDSARLPKGALSGITFLGLSLCLFSSLLNTVLGFLTLNFGIKGAGSVSSLSVNTAEKSS